MNRKYVSLGLGFLFVFGIDPTSWGGIKTREILDHPIRQAPADAVADEQGFKPLFSIEGWDATHSVHIKKSWYQRLDGKIFTKKVKTDEKGKRVTHSRWNADGSATSIKESFDPSGKEGERLNYSKDKQGNRIPLVGDPIHVISAHD